MSEENTVTTEPLEQTNGQQESQDPSNTTEEQQEKDVAEATTVTETDELPADSGTNEAATEEPAPQEVASGQQEIDQQTEEGPTDQTPVSADSEVVQENTSSIDDTQTVEQSKPAEDQQTSEEGEMVEDKQPLSEESAQVDDTQTVEESTAAVEDVQPVEDGLSTAEAVDGRDDEPVEDSQCIDGLAGDDEPPQDRSMDGGDHRPLSSVVPLEDIIEEDEVIDRETLLESIKDALEEQERMSAVSAQLEHKIAEYLISRKKTEDRADPGRGVTDQEKRYGQCMAALDQLKLQMRDMQDSFQLQEQELKVLRNEKLAQVRQANAEFAEYKKDQALTAVHSRSGKRITTQELEQYQSWEDRKEEEVIAVRLENIKLQNKIAKLEALIKEKEQLAEGLHMIDFEQLKINNVDLNEKIEERNEDILKLRRKVTSTVQVLTHVKEKLQFLQAESVEKRDKLREMDSVVAKNRDHLTRMKQARDSLRMDNNRLKQRGGLVGHKALLRDYEERKDQNEEMMDRLDTLQQHHSELSVVCDGLRRKIEQAKTINTHHL